MTDRYSRTHYVRLTKNRPWQDLTITQVDIQTVGGARAQYDFTYTDASAERSEKDDSPDTSDSTTVPYLKKITLPNGTAYEMSIGTTLLYNKTVGSGDPDDLGGTLKEIILPTDGRIAWEYQEYTNSLDQDNPFRTGTGVEKKKTKLRDGTVDGTWEYKQDIESDPGYDKERVVQVTYPTGDCSKHYFNERTSVHPQSLSGWEYGLPFSYRYTSGTDRYLSSEIWSGASGGGSCNGTKLRSTYLNFRWDGKPTTSDQEDWVATNRAVQASKVVFHDDGDRWIDTEMSDFDGLGHHRVVETTSNFWDGSTNDEERTVETNFNRTTGTYAWDTDNTEIPVSDPWVLGVFDYVETSEPDAVGESTARVEYDVDMDTGFPDCVRVLESGTTRSADDLLTVNVHDSLGLLTEVKRYGGDLQTIGTSETCPSGLGDPEYWVKHTYSNGTRKTSKPYEPDGTAGPFFTYDVDLDSSTGLPTRRRDTAGVWVDYTHDSSGRVTKVTPEEGAEPPLHLCEPLFARSGEGAGRLKGGCDDAGSVGAVV